MYGFSNLLQDRVSCEQRVDDSSIVGMRTARARALVITWGDLECTINIENLNTHFYFYFLPENYSTFMKNRDLFSRGAAMNRFNDDTPLSKKSKNGVS